MIIGTKMNQQQQQQQPNKKHKTPFTALINIGGGKQQPNNIMDVLRYALQEKIQLKRLQYSVPDIGTVVEELEMKVIKKPDDKVQATHKVSINGQLVRVMDVVENRIIQNDPQYEPWKFLKMNIKAMFDKMCKEQSNNNKTWIIYL